MAAKADLLGVIDAWDRAMISNDPVEIGRYMADDWTIVGPDGRVTGKAGFLAHIASGALTHDVMETHGARFHLVERVSCLYVRTDERWMCVSTHLSMLDAA